MNMIKACVIAVSMYSKIPMPQFEWEEKSMRYALAFFPLVGIIIGALQLLLFYVYRQNGLNGGIYAALATALPIAVTGGIHMDGYCDTIDALSAHQSKERRLEILKDANVGAFAVIWAVLYFVLYYGAWSSIASNAAGIAAGIAIETAIETAMKTETVMKVENKTVWLIAAGYVTSRALSGLAAVFFQNANKKGTLAAFSSSAGKGFVCTALILVLITASIFQIIVSPQTGVLILVGELLFFFYYHHMSKNYFGGITGDLAGWFLQCAELLILYLTVITTSIFA